MCAWCLFTFEGLDMARRTSCSMSPALVSDSGCGMRGLLSESWVLGLWMGSLRVCATILQALQGKKGHVALLLMPCEASAKDLSGALFSKTFCFELSCAAFPHCASPHARHYTRRCWHIWPQASPNAYHASTVAPSNPVVIGLISTSGSMGRARGVI